MKFSSSRFFYAYIAVATLLMVSGCKQESPVESIPLRSVLSVESVSPNRAMWPQYFSANGKIEAWQKASISSEIANLKLLEIHTDIGDSVKKGQVLARFDTASIKLDIEQAKAALLEAEANLLYAQKQAERNSRLKQMGTVSDDALLQSEVNAKSAKAKLVSAQASLDYQQFRLERAVITAPDDGVISQRHAQIGSVYTPGTVLFELIRQNRFEWQAEVTEAQYQRIEIGQNVDLSLDTNYQITGTIVRKAPLVDTSVLTATVYAELPIDHYVLGGSFASGKIELPPKQVTYLPQSAIVYRDGYKFVMAIVDNTIQAVRIETGQQFGNEIEILTPLDPESNFVKAGGAFLVNGDNVQRMTPLSSSDQGE